ncbi:hypothetical protein M0813_22207 [Anaeramoeba flamelloides]|uniref:Uncharacterized protein n=1 Tax=Anaeramoeba flamelloides TaxID=1746091 RepID=A0ABQ8YGP3_9EUKA|nr:hypothetical protein M0813_22207 [Anaeramoeba flamelloides]
MASLNRKKTNLHNSRNATINQSRLEKLMSMGNGVVKGLESESLGLANCPKEVGIEKSIFHRTYLVNDQQSQIDKKELEYFMIKKYNLFKTNPKDCKLIKNNKGDWVCYKFFKKTDFFEYQVNQADSEEFANKMFGILKLLRIAYRLDPKSFVGIKLPHIQYNYKVPSKVRIEKTALKQLCKENSSDNEGDMNSKIKKLYRALSFFFQARFNLINITNKNRKFMVFGRNHTMLENSNHSSDENGNHKNDSNYYVDKTLKKYLKPKSTKKRKRSIQLIDPKISQINEQKKWKKKIKKKHKENEPEKVYVVNKKKKSTKKDKHLQVTDISDQRKKKKNKIKHNRVSLKIQEKNKKKLKEKWTKKMIKQKLKQRRQVKQQLEENSNYKTCSNFVSIANNQPNNQPINNYNDKENGLINKGTQLKKKIEKKRKRGGDLGYDDEDILIQNWSEMSEEDLQSQLINLLLYVKNGENI